VSGGVYRESIDADDPDLNKGKSGRAITMMPVRDDDVVVHLGVSGVYFDHESTGRFSVSARPRKASFH
jgi:phosphate-selective porin